MTSMIIHIILSILSSNDYLRLRLMWENKWDSQMKRLCSMWYDKIWYDMIWYINEEEVKTRVENTEKQRVEV